MKVNTMGKQSAFTLIELLVVIAIIALLMGILIPVLHKAKEQGKNVLCMNNLRQVGIGANMYAEDYDQYVPRGAAGQSEKAWFQLFMPFLSQKPRDDDYRNVEIYRCPSYPEKEQTICFVINGWTFDDRSDVTGREIIQPTRLTGCTQRARTIYLADNEDGPWRHIVTAATSDGNNRCDVWNPGHLPSSDSEDVTRGRRVAQSRHKNGCNFLFLDWHVDWLSAENVTVDMWRFRR